MEAHAAGLDAAAADVASGAEPAEPPAEVAASLTSGPPCARAEDRDCDGVPDARDHCPLEPEDCDGFEDADGCPDLDDDHDGVADTCDRCPRSPEDFDGEEDQDGCPEGEPGLAGRELRVPSWITFARGSTALAREQQELLSEVARSIQDAPRLRLLACVGSRESAEPAALALQRARAVCAGLRSQGVDAERLVAAERAPLAPDEEPPPRAVRFVTLETREVRFRVLRGREVLPPPEGPQVLQPPPAPNAIPSCPGGALPPPPRISPRCGAR